MPDVKGISLAELLLKILCKRPRQYYFIPEVDLIKYFIDGGLDVVKLLPVEVDQEEPIIRQYLTHQDYTPSEKLDKLCANHFIKELAEAISKNG